MPATRLYLRSTTTNTGGAVKAEKSVAKPVGSADVGSSVAQDLLTVAGGAQTSVSIASFAQTAHQDSYTRQWQSAQLGVSSIDANTWTLALALSESNTNLNAFLTPTIYVLANDDTVRGFVVDSDTTLGVEYGATEDGQVVTVAGSAVSGVVPTDRLVFEWWSHAVSSMATSYNFVIYYNGSVDVTDTTTTNAASYIETPQDLFPAGAKAPRPTVTPTIAVRRAAYW